MVVTATLTPLQIVRSFLLRHRSRGSDRELQPLARHRLRVDELWPS
jgi:hypothetical protein